MPDTLYYNDGKGHIRQVPANKVTKFKKYFPGATPAREEQLSAIENKRAAQSEQEGKTIITAPKPAQIDTSNIRGQVSLPGSAPVSEVAKDVMNIHRQDPDISFRAKYGAYKEQPELFRDQEADITQTQLTKEAQAQLKSVPKENIYIPGSPTIGQPGFTTTRTSKKRKEEELESLQDFLTNTPQGRGFVELDEQRKKQLDEYDQQLVQQISELEKEVERAKREDYLRKIKERARGEGIEIPKDFGERDIEKAGKLMVIKPSDDIILAEENLSELKKQQAAIQDVKEGRSDISQFFREFGRRIPGALPTIASGGITELDKAIQNQFFKKKPGELATRSENLLSEYATIHQLDRSIAQDIAQGTVGSLEFMSQFAVAGGAVSGITKGIGKRILTEGAKKAVKGAGKTVKIAGKEISEALLQTAIMPATLANAVENNAENPGSFLDAYANSYLSNLVEVGSEKVGQFIPGPKFNLPGSIQKLQRVTGIDGIAGEFLEEQIATVGHAALGDGQGQWSDLIDPRQQLITAGVVSVIQLPYASINAGGYAAGKFKNTQQKRSINKAYTNNIAAMRSALGKEAEPTMKWLNSALDQAMQTDEGVARLMTSLANQNEFDEGQTNTILKYGLSYIAKKGLETAKEEQVQGAQVEAQETIKQVVNPETQSIILAKVPGVENPVQIQGEIVLNPDGSVDTHVSKEVFYTDSQGKRQVVDPKFIDIIENVPAEQALQELTALKTAEVINEQANDEVRPYEPGEIVRFTGDGNIAIMGQIQGIDEDGNYMIAVDGAPTPVSIEPRMIINEDNLLGVDNGVLVDYEDQSGNIITGEVEDMSLRGNGIIVIGGEEVQTERVIGVHREGEAQTQSTDNMPQKTPESEDFPAGEIEQNVSATAETETKSQISPEQQALNQVEMERQAFMQSLPLVETGKNKGQIDQSRMTPEQNIRYFEYQYGKDKAVEAARKMGENLSKRIKKEQAKLDGDPFNIAQNELVENLKAQEKAYRDYAFTQMQAQTEKNMTTSTGPSVTEARDKRSARIKEEEKGRAGEAGQPVKDRWNKAEKIEGVEDVITLANGEKISGRYILTSAEAPSPSHDIQRNFAKTAGYPINELGNTVNDRDYEHDKTAQVIVEQRANNYDERAVQTPVVVSKEGVVISGNDRTMSGQLAAMKGTDKAYVDYITKYADRWGFTPEMVQSIKSPRIVFVPDADLPYNTETFAKFNAEEKKTQNTIETAIKASKSISRDIVIPIANVIDRFKNLTDFYNDTQATQEVIQILTQNKVVQTNELPRLLDRDVFSAEGRSFLETIMLGAVLQEQALREIDYMRSARQTLMRIMPQLMRNASLKEYTLISELNNAIHLLYEANRAGSKIKLHLSQTKIFDLSPQEVYAEVEKTLALLLENAKDTEIRAIFESYNQEAVLIESGQQNMFEGVLSKPDLLKIILNRYGQTVTTQQAGTTPERNGQGEGDRSGRSAERPEQPAEQPTEPTAGQTGQEVEPLKQQQFAIIQSTNPVVDDIHTGIRSADEILSAEEAFSYNITNDINATPDFTVSDMIKALESGTITVYSSYPIENGVFVTPSKIEAQNYAGEGKVYSKKTSLNNVAWISQFEGQYAELPTEQAIEQPTTIERIEQQPAKQTDIQPDKSGFRERWEKLTSKISSGINSNDYNIRPDGIEYTNYNGDKIFIPKKLAEQVYTIKNKIDSIISDLKTGQVINHARYGEENAVIISKVNKNNKGDISSLTVTSQSNPDFKYKIDTSDIIVNDEITIGDVNEAWRKIFLFPGTYDKYTINTAEKILPLLEVKPNIEAETNLQKEPWEMTIEEFSQINPEWLSESREKSFKEWAKEKNIDVPNVDLGKLFGMSMINNKTLREKGLWKGEFKRYAKYENIYKQYLEEVPLKKNYSKPNIAQLRVLHKRSVRQALSEGKPVPREILNDYPDLIKSNAKTEGDEAVFEPQATQLQINWDEAVGAVPAIRNEGFATDSKTKEVQKEAGYDATIDNRLTAMERILTNQGTINFVGEPPTGPAKITGANDVAFLFKNLESAASENVFTVVVNKDGDYRVLYQTTGSSYQSISDPKMIATIVKDFGATKIWMVHNHPSGSLRASAEDVAAHKRLVKLASIMDIEVMPSIIINLDSGKYVEFDSTNIDSEIKDRPVEIESGEVSPVPVYSFDRQKLYSPSSERTRISSPQDVALFLSQQKRGAIDKLQILILDRSNAITRYFLVDGKLKGRELSKIILPEIGRSGENVIIAGNGNVSAVKSIKADLESVGAHLLDVLTIKQDQDIINNYRSYANEGLLEEQAEYNKTTPATININGVEKPTTNSDGNPIASTEEGVRNFWKWFGDSKVVDSEGRPMVVYHGTGNKFSTFSMQEGAMGKGAYFTSVFEEAADYAAEKLDEQLSEENDMGGKWYGEYIIPVYLKIIDANNIARSSYGGDGYIYLATNPNQVKSVDNVGTFDSGNDDIRFSMIDEAGFYSTVEEALDDIKQEKGTVEQMKAMLLKNGAKQAEMEWMGWDDQFRDPTQKVTKDDVQDWIDQNRIEVEEVKKEITVSELPQATDLLPEAQEEYDKLNDIAGRWKRWEEFEDELDLGEVVSKWRRKNIEEWESEYGSYDYIYDKLLPEIRNNPDNWDYSYEVRDDTKYHSYTLPGGENYKELLLTMPIKSHSYRKNNGKWEVINNKTGKITAIENNEESAKEAVKFFSKAETGVRQFRSNHFKEPNILAHVRFDEREVNGERVLFIEEIQSDWAQKGREKGFKLPISKEEILKNYKFEIKEDTINGEKGWYANITNKSNNKFIAANFNTDKNTLIKILEKTAIEHYNNTSIPNMPFKQTPQWVNLALRRMIRYAAENGFDRIAWTSGEQQAERYDLSKQVDKIAYQKRDKGYFVSAMINGNGNPLNNGSEISEDNLEEYVGKEVAQKIVNGEGSVENYAGNNEPRNEFKELSGTDLKVGGEGMKAFYDQIIPKAAKKLGKPFGAEIETIDIITEKSAYESLGGEDVVNMETGEPETGVEKLKDKTITVQSIPVTSKMKEVALQGMPLFSFGEKMTDLDERLESATGEDGKADVVKSILDEIEGSHDSPIVSTVVKNKSELIGLLRMMGANEYMVSEAEGSDAPIHGVYYDGMIIINAETVRSSKSVLKVWAHENFHAWMKNRPDLILPLRGMLSDKELNSNLAKGYNKLPRDKKIEEILAFAVGQVYTGDPITRNRTIRDQIDPIIKQYLDYVTNGRFSRSNPDFGRGQKGNEDALFDNQTSRRESAGAYQQGESPNKQRAEDKTVLPGNEGVPGEVADHTKVPMPQQKDGQSVEEYAREVSEWFNERRRYTNAQPLFSISDVAEDVGSKMTEDLRKEYDVKYNQFFTRFREAWEDTFLPVKEFLDLLRKNGVEIAEHNDIYKMATHVSGKNDAQLNQYKEYYQKPISLAVNKLEKLGFTYRDIENYVFSKHGIERNEYMRAQAVATLLERNPDATDEEIAKINARDFAGITALVEELGKPVEEYIKEFEEKAGESPVNDLWSAINKATHYTIEKQYQTGMISKDTYDELTARYKFYVPLRGHDAEVAEDRWDYSPDMGTFFTAPLLKAKGRRSRAESPFAYIGQMAHSAITQGNKNTLKQALLRLARKENGGLMSVSKSWNVNIGTSENPIWEMQSAPYSDDIQTYLNNQEAFEARMRELEAEGMAFQSGKKLDIGGLFIKPRQAEQHEVHVYQNGVNYTIYINANPAIARSINGANRKDIVQQMGFLSNVTRNMAANFTTRNPLFVMTNFSRDYIYATTMILAKETPKYEKQFQGNIPKSLGALQRYLRGKMDLGNESDRYLYEYLMNGAKTGFSHIFELNRVAKKLERESRKGDAVEWKDAGRAVLDVIDSFNEGAENLTRLSVYITSRQNGRSIIQSVDDAKNITVNFNQKGAGSSAGKNAFEQFIFEAAGWVRPLFLFTNAAIQSLSNIVKVTNKHPGKMAGIVSSYALLGYISPILAAMVGGDDGEDSYMKLTDWERQNNWCIMLPNGSFLKIPLPHEMRIFHRLGDNIYQTVTGKQDILQTLMDTMFSISDLLPMNPMGAATASWAELSPDAIRPIAQIATNKNFMGSQVYNKWANENLPGYLKARTNKKGEYYAPNFMVDWFMFIDDKTGGDGVKKGLISLNPDIVNHLLRGYFGGLYTLTEQALGMVQETYQFTQTGEFDLKIRETPLKAFYADKNDLRLQSSGLTNKYYKVTDKINKARMLNKGYLKKVNEGEMSIEEYSRKVKDLDMMNVSAIYERIKEIRKMESALIEMTPEEQKEAEKAIFEMKKEVVDLSN